MIKINDYSLFLLRVNVHDNERLLREFVLRTYYVSHLVRTFFVLILSAFIRRTGGGRRRRGSCFEIRAFSNEHRPVEVRGTTGNVRGDKRKTRTSRNLTADGKKNDKSRKQMQKRARRHWTPFGLRGVISLALRVIYEQTQRLHLLDPFTSLQRIMYS